MRQRLSRRVSGERHGAGENGVAEEFRTGNGRRIGRVTRMDAERGPGSLRKNQASTPTRSKPPHSNGIPLSQADMGPGSVTSSTGTTSDACTKASTICRRPTGSSPPPPPEVLRTLRTQVAANALELARPPSPGLHSICHRPGGRPGTSAPPCMPQGEACVLDTGGQLLPRSRSGSAGQATTDNAMPPPLCPGHGSPSGEESGTSGGDEPGARHITVR